MATTSKKDSISQPNWFFTIMNYTENDVKCVKSVPCKRIVSGYEIAPTTGTPHIHGSIIFAKNMRRKAVCAALGGRADVRPLKGDWADQCYCIKDGKVLRMEDNRKQGQRTDLKRFYSDISQGLPELQVAERNLSAYCKYQKAYSRVRALYDKKAAKAFRKVKVTVIWGDTGKRKTSRVLYDYGEDVCIGPSSFTPEWWDGYDGEDAILIDDFYGQIPISRMLRILDGHRLNLPVKGGFRWAKWTKVYITSNVHPNEWYSGVPDRVRDALKRRIDKIERV